MPDRNTDYYSWQTVGFFVAFLSWFAFPPLIPDAIKSDLNLTNAQVANSNIVALAATLIVRFAVGPMVDAFGPRKVMAGLLVLGAIPSGLAGTAHNANTLYVIRFFIGILGGTFVPCQAWTSSWFDKNCVGTVNALVGGWGNMGGGATFAIMTSLYAALVKAGMTQHVAWRASFAIVPLPCLLLVAVMTLIFGQDHPAGKWSERQNLLAATTTENQGGHTPPFHADNEKALSNKKDKSDKHSGDQVTVHTVDGSDVDIVINSAVDVAVNEKLTLKSTVEIVLSPLTWLPSLAYLTTFGLELALDAQMANVLFALYSKRIHGFDQTKAGYYTSIFGFLNLFTRPFGGYVGDVVYRNWGTKGKHPFNAEAKLNVLFSKGFLTPSNLFFVRNHGAVPQVDTQTAREWKVAIHGLCENPVIFTVEELRSKFEVITVPVTLVCAGNRRKEQNVVQKSLGFSWGAAGLSTALFTGVRLADVLDYVKPIRGAKHVVFEGSDSLPNASSFLGLEIEGEKYRLQWIFSLEPDHGFPLRLVVPGQIGGRSVKWLGRIELSPFESQHHLHFHDNKVIPMPVGPDRARAEKEWWYDPRYMIRELNVNSAVACPDHGEIIEAHLEGTYTLRGYAYAGGGRRITRVEVSINEGNTWELAEIEYPEDVFRSVAFADSVYGALDLTDSDQCYCWSFWSLTVPLRSLRDSQSICVRAMDESLALQPRNMYWNATGMMNNWWFRVCIHILEDGRMKFEHPTMAGNQPGGWMQRLKDWEWNYTYSSDVWVMDINRDVGDILCRDELDELAKAHSSRLFLRYSLTGKSIPHDWKQSLGRLNANMMNKYLPPPSNDGLICICGPPAMERMAK
ncbi:hypothetical protein C0993_011292, partial [Termitomyces sp. T159_Od127]